MSFNSISVIPKENKCSAFFSESISWQIAYTLFTPLIIILAILPINGINPIILANIYNFIFFLSSSIPFNPIFKVLLWVKH